MATPLFSSTRGVLACHLPTHDLFARIVLLVFALVMGQAIGAKIPKHYYPHQTKTYWEYSNGEAQVVGTSFKHRNLNLTVIQHKHAGTGLVVLEDLMEYRPDGSVWLRGLRSGGKVTSWYNPPLQIYPAGPLRAGMKWKSQSGNILRESEVLGPTRLVTSAGKFNALFIHTKTIVTGTESEEYTYFVPTVGIIRKQMLDGTVFDLLKFRSDTYTLGP